MMVDYRISGDERAQFKRCRRQWDFASRHRRNLQASGFVEAALPAALKEALAVYYYPGTWDWQHEVTQPLVHKALERSLDEAGAADSLAQGAALLDCYDAWANAVDDFAPVKINLDVDALVPDPDDPERGLLVHDGSPVIYSCRIDLVAVDAADEYWVVCHQIVDDWRDSDTAGARRAGGSGLLGLRARLHRRADRWNDPQRGAHRRSALIPGRRVRDEAIAESRGPTRGQRWWSIAPAAPAGVSASITPHRNRPDRAAHRRCAASYPHPSEPPRDRLGGINDRCRGRRYD